MAVIGATGYTGVELLRLLSAHRDVEVTVVTSRSESGRTLADYWGYSPYFKELSFSLPEPDFVAEKADVAFLCVPHGTAQEIAADLLTRGLRVIDLSADFRLKSAELYERWYGIEHRYPELLKEAVYGLSEVYRNEIRSARLIANPGCYPTSVLLALVPLVKERLVDTEDIVIDSKSGVSGAGRKRELRLSFCEVNEDLKAYGVASHRHTPEIEEELSKVAGREVKVVFVPHLVPMQRGILSTIYATTSSSEKELYEALRDFYRGCKFVEVLPPGSIPRTAEVRGSNFCRIGFKLDPRTGRLILLSVIDNLVKGASGQAVQNLNIMTGFPEETGLPFRAVFP